MLATGKARQAEEVSLSYGVAVHARPRRIAPRVRVPRLVLERARAVPAVAFLHPAGLNALDAAGWEAALCVSPLPLTQRRLVGPEVGPARQYLFARLLLEAICGGTQLRFQQPMGLCGLPWVCA